MTSFLSKKVVIGAAAVVVLACAGGAVAATQSSTSPGAQAQAYLNDLAGKLGVTPSALSAAIKAADSDQINAALAAGRLSAAQAAALNARIQASTTAPLFGGGFGRHGFGGGGRSGIDAAAATYLGISETTLRSDLAAGQSLNAIAAATANKSAAGLKAAIIAAETTELNTAVSNNQITSAQEAQRLSDLSSRIDALLARTWTPGSGGWGGHARGGYGIFGGGPTA